LKQLTLDAFITELAAQRLLAKLIELGGKVTVRNNTRFLEATFNLGLWDIHRYQEVLRFLWARRIVRYKGIYDYNSKLTIRVLPWYLKIVGRGSEEEKTSRPKRGLMIEVMA
jgi:hypothetical protein